MIAIRLVQYLDSRFLIERLDFDYVVKDSALIKTNVRYADVPIAGTAVRMRTSGTAAGRPLELATVNWISGIFAFAYFGFERVRP